MTAMRERGRPWARPKEREREKFVWRRKERERGITKRNMDGECQKGDRALMEIGKTTKKSKTDKKK